MTAKDKSALMAAMRERREREGVVRLDVWVPRDCVEKVRKYVERLSKNSQEQKK